MWLLAQKHRANPENLCASVSPWPILSVPLWRILSVALVLGLATHGSAVTASKSTPVLVELFTSEGCSSCPPADALLRTLADTQPIAGAEIIALSQHVDYWDQLGWRDRFSSAALTNRQQQYGRAFNIDSIYTPQMVVDGREEFVGSDASRARRAIGKALSAPHALVSIALDLTGSDRVAVTVTARDLPDVSRGDHADTVVAVTEDRLRSEVRSGENKGRLLTHTAVVRELRVVRGATPPDLSARSEVTLAPDWQREHLRIVAFLQERASRRVLGAAAVPLPSARR